MGMMGLVESITAQPATAIALLLTCIIAWYLTRKLFPTPKSPEEMKAQMANSSARVMITIQWCGG